MVTRSPVIQKRNRLLLFSLLTLVYLASGCSTQKKTDPLLNLTIVPLTQASITQNENSRSMIISPYDEMPLIYIPEGGFIMGSPLDDEGTSEDESPQRLVYLSGYWIDQFEVTNRMFGECVAKGVCKAPSELISLQRNMYFDNLSFAEHPVINVDWNQAKTYCEWVGRRLPTEAEWEKAARGTDGRMYPWGNQPPSCDLLSFGKSSVEETKCVSDTTRGGKYPRGGSPYFVMDMAGNVWEWVADWYDPNYYRLGINENPLGPDTGLTKVVRGGSFLDGSEGVHTANRHQTHPGADSYFVGFRCAVSGIQE